jgi:hypothetical protein
MVNIGNANSPDTTSFKKQCQRLWKKTRDSITNCFAPKRKELRSEGFLIALYVLAVAQQMNGTDESGVTMFQNGYLLLHHPHDRSPGRAIPARAVVNFSKFGNVLKPVTYESN